VPIIFIIHLKTKELQIEWLEPFTMPLKRITLQHQRATTKLIPIFTATKRNTNNSLSALKQPAL
jgi:hypothetical protein